MRVSDGLRQPKVLILSVAFPPENLPGAARPYRFYRYLPEYGYSTGQIDRICGMIMATQIPQTPHNKLEEITLAYCASFNISSRAMAVRSFAV